MADLEAIPPGLVHGLEEQGTATKAAVAVFLTIALANAIELIVLILWTFHRYRGLYFWSMIVSVSGVILNSIGSILHYFNFGPLWLGLPLLYTGFMIMVPPQSLVLYSRLYLVFYNDRILRYLLIVIIIALVLLLTPDTVITYVAAALRTPPANLAYNIIERYQVTGFSVLEISLSLFYVYATAKLLRHSPEGKPRIKQILYELLAINFITMALDIATIVLQFINLNYLQICLKPLIYSVKLKMELAILGRLVAFTNLRRAKIQLGARNAEFMGTAFGLDDLGSRGTENEGSGFVPSGATETNSTRGLSRAIHT